MVAIAGKQIPKWAVVLVLFLAAGFVIGGASRLFSSALESGSGEAPSTEVAAPEPQSEPAVSVPAYTIARTEDLSFANAVRTQYRVVVPGEPTEADLRAVVDDVIAKAKEGAPFNAVSVGLFASKDEIDGAYTLGVAELAPDGEWDKADTVEAGDYDAMKLTVEIY